MVSLFSNRKIVVVGAGAIGSFYGGLLRDAGYDVTLICRGRHLEAIKKSGLRIKSFKLGEKVIDIKASDKLDKKYDIGIISVKSQDTETACLMLQNHLSDDGFVVSFQNGVDNKDIIKRYFSEDKILLATLFVGLHIDPPGVVNHSAAGNITFGAATMGGKKYISVLEEIFKRARFEYKVDNNIEKVLWKKLLWNIAFNPLSALLESTCGKMVADSKIKDLMNMMILEGVKAASFDGVEIEKEYYENVINMTKNLENYKTSMLQDIEKGKNPEVDGILMPVIRRHLKHGVEAPYCDTIYRALKFKYGSKFIYTPKLTVDVIVENSKGAILLIERKNPPYGWALPGGFVDYGERVEDAAKRELFEETNINVNDIKLLGVYSDPKRDPRGHTVSVVYYTEFDGHFEAGDDAKSANFFSKDRLPSLIAFDHRKILNDYFRLKNNFA
ncbi:2-dehydropantoate 2-reductase [Deferribacter abyssi]|uniref:2-dehydropantoate 2-reductase n=1 Tax=Deferribacter abyssi TaxID=213806 RepID=UPI003C226F2B